MKNHVKRIPIVSRTAIFRRKPIYVRTSWDKCKVLSNGFLVCGNPQKSNIETMYVPFGFTEWHSLEQSIWNCHGSHKVLRLITEVELPKNIIWATSYSEKNILQINLNLLRAKHNIDWIDQMMNLADRCGIYVVLHMHPVVPEVIKTCHVIQIIDRVSGKGCFHANINFLSFHKKVAESPEYINFNGIPVKKEYLVETIDGWTCSKEFKERFLSILKMYTVPKHISISACGDNKDCTGLTKAKEINMEDDYEEN